MANPSAWSTHLKLAKMPLNAATVCEIEYLRDILSKFSYFVNSRQFDLYRTILSKDCEFTNVAMKRSVKGRETVIKFMKGQAKLQKTVPASSKHHQSNMIARVNRAGTSAVATCYLNASSILRAEFGGHLVLWGGWYTFNFIKESSNWFISAVAVNRRFEIKIPGVALRGPGELPPEVGF